MRYEEHVTRIESPIDSSGCPIGLNDATSLLVVERPNFVPIYGRDVMNFVEATVEAAKMRGEPTLAHNAIRELDVIRGDPNRILGGMFQYGIRSPYINGIVYSEDFTRDNPSIDTPMDARFSLEFKLREFDSGKSGRLLRDPDGTVYAERLRLVPSIYDVLDLATSISPFQIYAKSEGSNPRLIYHNGDFIGELDESPRSNNEGPNRFTLYEQDMIGWNPGTISVLPHDPELAPTTTKLVSDIAGPNTLAIVGYDAASLNNLVRDAKNRDSHLLWNIHLAQRIDRDPNRALVDLENEFGLENRVARFPFHRNRFALYDGNAVIDIGHTYLSIGKTAATQSVLSAEDSIRDVWIDPPYDPEDRNGHDGWDIMLDKSRGITPDKKVRMRCLEHYERFPVLTN